MELHWQTKSLLKSLIKSKMKKNLHPSLLKLVFIFFSILRIAYTCHTNWVVPVSHYVCM